MKKLSITLIFLLFPFFACAHAVPVESSPSFGSLVTSPPSELRVKFSEHIATGSPTLRLFMATGSPILLTPVIDATDTHIVTARLPQVSGGVTIAWGVISADDGHFTEGGIGFIVGKQRESGPQREFNVLNAILFFLLLGIAFRASSFFVFERHPRCENCEKAYTLVEVGLLSLLLASLAFFAKAPNDPPIWKHTSTHQGRMIDFSIREGEALAMITITDQSATKPLLEIEDRDDHIYPMEVPLTKVESKGSVSTYAFPVGFFTPHAKWHVSLTFVTPGHYDVEDVFDIRYPDDISQASENGTKTRSLYALIVFCAIFLVGVLRRAYLVFSGRTSRIDAGVHSVPARHAYALALLALFILGLAGMIVAYPWG